MTKEKILIVEDEKDLVKILKYNIEKEGFRVVSASDGDAGLKQFQKEKPDLILLDLMLPKMDGMEVCKIIRKGSKVPIIMLTAKKEEVDRILGLELGADDYVTKPFSIRELLARIKGIFRRLANKKEGSPILKAGSLEIDFARHEIQVGGKSVKLRPKEFDLLRHLVEADGRVLSRDELLKLVWGHEESFDIDTRTVDQHIARMRVKLKSESDRIETVHNMGYKFKIG